MANAPVPVGVGNSFNSLAPNQRTPSFMPVANTQDQSGVDNGAIFVVSFAPIDVNNAGVLTLYDAAGNTALMLNQEGYETFQPTPGMSYYFNSTLGAKQVSFIQPSSWR
jgi:hypothetical protein